MNEQNQILQMQLPANDASKKNPEVMVACQFTCLTSGPPLSALQCVELPLIRLFIHFHIPDHSKFRWSNFGSIQEFEFAFSAFFLQPSKILQNYFIFITTNSVCVRGAFTLPMLTDQIDSRPVETKVYSMEKVKICCFHHPFCS